MFSEKNARGLIAVLRLVSILFFVATASLLANNIFSIGLVGFYGIGLYYIPTYILMLYLGVVCWIAANRAKTLASTFDEDAIRNILSTFYTFFKILAISIVVYTAWTLYSLYTFYFALIPALNDYSSRYGDFNSGYSSSYSSQYSSSSQGSTQF